MVSGWDETCEQSQHPDHDQSYRKLQASHGAFQSSVKVIFLVSVHVRRYHGFITGLIFDVIWPDQIPWPGRPRSLRKLQVQHGHFGREESH